VRAAFLVGALALLVFTAPAKAEPTKTTFTLVGQSFNLTIPDGYCAPDEKSKAVADTLASADPQNVTDFTYFDCKIATSAAGERRYGILKTPKNTLIVVLPPRADLLKEFGKLIADGSLAKALATQDLVGDANKSIKETTGVDLKISGTPKFVEADDRAAYIVGVMSGGEDAQRKFALAGALTEVKGRLISWYVYGPYRSDADVAALLREVKAYIAGFIAENGG
jgi:hypothetical protein